jgi:hypothetical protein
VAGRVLPGTYSTVVLAGACAYAIVADRMRTRAIRSSSGV